MKTKTLGFQPIEKAIEEGLEKKGFISSSHPLVQFLSEY